MSLHPLAETLRSVKAAWLPPWAFAEFLTVGSPQKLAQFAIRYARTWSEKRLGCLFSYKSSVNQQGSLDAEIASSLLEG